MLLRIFKTSQPLSWILIVMIISVLRLVLFFLFHTEVHLIDNDFFSHQLLNKLNTNFPWSSHFISTVFVLFSGLFFNRIAQNLNILNGIHYLLFLFFGILISFQIENLSLSPLILATPLMLICFNLILIQFQGTLPLGHVFNASFFIGLASLIYFPSTLLLIILVWSLVYLNQTTWRHFILALLGYSVPILFFDTLIFSFSLPLEYISSLWALQYHSFDINNFTPLYATSAIISLIVLQSSLYFRSISKSIIKIRKALSLSYWYLILGLLFNGFLVILYPNLIGIIILPTTILFTVFHLEIKKWWASDLFFILFIGTMVLTYLEI